MINQQGSTVTSRRAVLYLRFAKVDPAGHRVDVVRDACRRRAKELGAIVVAEYVDIGSGLNGERPQLGRMLSRLAGITDVIVPEYSSVARRMDLYENIIRKLEQAGAQLVVASESLTGDPDPAEQKAGVLAGASTSKAVHHG